jgi:hypothetical protein
MDSEMILKVNEQINKYKEQSVNFATASLYMRTILDLVKASIEAYEKGNFELGRERLLEAREILDEMRKRDMISKIHEPISYISDIKSFYEEGIEWKKEKEWYNKNPREFMERFIPSRVELLWESLIERVFR